MSNRSNATASSIDTELQHSQEGGCAGPLMAAWMAATPPSLNDISAKSTLARRGAYQASTSTRELEPSNNPFLHSIWLPRQMDGTATAAGFTLACI